MGIDWLGPYLKNLPNLEHKLCKYLLHIRIKGEWLFSNHKQYFFFIGDISLNKRSYSSRILGGKLCLHVQNIITYLGCIRIF